MAMVSGAVNPTIDIPDYVRPGTKPGFFINSEGVELPIPAGYQGSLQAPQPAPAVAVLPAKPPTAISIADRLRGAMGMQTDAGAAEAAIRELANSRVTPRKRLTHKQAMKDSVAESLAKRFAELDAQDAAVAAQAQPVEFAPLLPPQ